MEIYNDGQNILKYYIQKQINDSIKCKTEWGLDGEKGWLVILYLVEW